MEDVFGLYLFYDELYALEDHDKPSELRSTDPQSTDELANTSTRLK